MHVRLRGLPGFERLSGPSANINPSIPLSSRAFGTFLPNMHSSHFWIFLLFFSLAHANCFLPNGTDRNVLYPGKGQNYLPCDTSSEFSMCCRTYEPGGFPVDVCEGSFCRNSKTKELWRESCSDATWKSEGCVKLCVEGEDGDVDVMLTECPDGSLCCGNSNNLCCDRGGGKWVVDGKILSTNPNPSASSSASSTTSSTAVSTSLDHASASSDSSRASHASVASVTQDASTETSTQGPAAAGPRNKTPIIAGSVVAGIAGLALVVGLVWLVLRRRASAPKPPLDTAAHVHQGAYGSKAVWEMNGAAVAELGDQRFVPEMTGDARPTELEAREKPTSFADSGTNERSGLLR
ncbi:hypothetical protein K505DRAFT_378563 [Melanomma pulvis-pyrius CBS 109.77]|uniref:Mid2 domain-containing protein n=1 Tax=Melanomma pulvis-pyrius CBS 109.77 TaxID=1314802 RepID=A0A6A6WYG0_9PLEO|nr:hypothetical protein K505DRAFT_378563 [Melanomma pulvis-pyrius CBS 109.77]